MTHTYTKKDAKLYRYYTCLRAQKRGWDSCTTKSVPAGEIERFVVDQIRCVGQDPGLVAETLESFGQDQRHLVNLPRDPPESFGTVLDGV